MPNHDYLEKKRKKNKNKRKRKRKRKRKKRRNRVGPGGFRSRPHSWGVDLFYFSFLFKFMFEFNFLFFGLRFQLTTQKFEHRRGVTKSFKNPIFLNNSKYVEFLGCYKFPPLFPNKEMGLKFKLPCLNPPQTSSFKLIFPSQDICQTCCKRIDMKHWKSPLVFRYWAIWKKYTIDVFEYSIVMQRNTVAIDLDPCFLIGQWRSPSIAWYYRSSALRSSM